MNDVRINRCLRWLTDAVANDYQNDALSPILKDKVEKFYQSVNSCIDWDNLIAYDLRNLGFMRYEDEGESSTELWLIPQWLYPIIPDEIELMNIQGEMFTFDRKTTPYTLFYGCMTYGVCIHNPLRNI